MSVTVTGRARRGRRGLLAACIGYVTILLLLPLAAIIITALQPGLSVVLDTFSEPYVQHAFVLVLATSALLKRRETSS